MDYMKLDSRVSKYRNSVCVGDAVDKRWVGRRQNYLYIHSLGGAFSEVSFRTDVIV